MKDLRIEMNRGDFHSIRFWIKTPQKEVYTDPFQDIFFSVKHSFRDKEPVFQKRLSEGQIVQLVDGSYQMGIYPDDTNNLRFSEYDFDIELMKDNGQYKKTFSGKIAFGKEVTHAENEGEI